MLENIFRSQRRSTQQSNTSEIKVSNLTKTFDPIVMKNPFLQKKDCNGKWEIAP